MFIAKLFAVLTIIWAVTFALPANETQQKNVNGALSQNNITENQFTNATELQKNVTGVVLQNDKNVAANVTELKLGEFMMKLYIYNFV